MKDLVACARARRRRRARLAARALSRRWRGDDDRHRPHHADARPRACRASDRPQARTHRRERVDAGFGFEALGLAVTVAERIEPQQTDLDSAADGQRRGTLRRAHRPPAAAARPAQRAAAQAGRKPSPRTRRDGLCRRRRDPAWPAQTQTRPRPLFLLPHAEPADVHRARSRRSAAALPLARRDA